MLPASPKCLFPVPHWVEAPVFDPQHLSREVVTGITSSSVCMEAEKISQGALGVDSEGPGAHSVRSS